MTKNQMRSEGYPPCSLVATTRIDGPESWPPKMTGCPGYRQSAAWFRRQNNSNSWRRPCQRSPVRRCRCAQLHRIVSRKQHSTASEPNRSRVALASKQKRRLESEPGRMPSGAGSRPVELPSPPAVNSAVRITAIPEQQTTRFLARRGRPGRSATVACPRRGSSASFDPLRVGGAASAFCGKNGTSA